MTASRLTQTPATVLSHGAATPITQAITTDNDLWLKLPDLAASTGWELKPEGVCRDDVCIPISAGESEKLLLDNAGQRWFNVAKFARDIRQPCAYDAQYHVWSFGPPPYEWQSRVASTVAPNFTLPDFQGKLHSLSDYRGKKVLLATWASW